MISSSVISYQLSVISYQWAVFHWSVFQ